MFGKEKNWVLGGAKFSSLALVDLTGRGSKEEIFKLGKYVMERRVFDALPLWDHIPGGSGDESEQVWPWAQ